MIKLLDNTLYIYVFLFLMCKITNKLTSQKSYLVPKPRRALFIFPVLAAHALPVDQPRGDPVSLPTAVGVHRKLYAIWEFFAFRWSHIRSSDLILEHPANIIPNRVPLGSILTDEAWVGQE